MQQLLEIVVLGVYKYYINIPYRIQVLSGVIICLHIHLGFLCNIRGNVSLITYLVGCLLLLVFS